MDKRSSEKGLVALRSIFCLSHKPKSDVLWDFGVRPDHICLLVLTDPSVKCCMSHEAGSIQVTLLPKSNTHSALLLKEHKHSRETLDKLCVPVVLISAVLLLLNTLEHNFNETRKTLLCASNIIAYLCQTPQYDNGLW